MILLFFILSLLILIGIFLLPNYIRKEVSIRRIPMETIVLPASNWRVFVVQMVVTFGIFALIAYCSDSSIDEVANVFIWIYFAIFVWGVFYFLFRPSIFIKNGDRLVLTSPIKAMNKSKWDEIVEMKIVKPEWYMRFGRMASTDKLIVITTKGETKLYDSSYSSNAWNEITQFEYELNTRRNNGFIYPVI